MSLINEALKKAQHMRSGESDLPASTEQALGAARSADAARKRERKLLLGILAALALLLAISATALVTLSLTRGKEELAEVAHKEPAIAERATAPKTAPAPVINPAPAAPVPKATEPVIQLPAQAMAANPASSQAPQSAAQKAAELQKALEAQKALVEQKAREAEEARLQAAESSQAYIDALRVTGVRVSGGSSRVLLNDRLYKPGDMLDRRLGLTLVEIRSDRLVFKNKDGEAFERRF